MLRPTQFPVVPKHPANALVAVQPVDSTILYYAMWLVFPLVSICSFVMYLYYRRRRPQMVARPAPQDDYAAIHINREQFAQVPHYRFGFFRKNVRNGWIETQDEV